MSRPDIIKIDKTSNFYKSQQRDLITKATPHIKKTFSFGHFSTLHPLPPIRASCTTFFGRPKRHFSAYLIRRITEPSNDDNDNDGSDNCDHDFGT